MGLPENSLSEYVKEFPIGSIVKVVDNDSGEFITLGFIEKYEVTGMYNFRPILLKIKKRWNSV